LTPVVELHLRWMIDRAKSVVQKEGLMALLRRMKHRLRSMLRGEATLSPYAIRDVRDQYRRWRHQHAMTGERLDAIRRDVASLLQYPVLSFAMPLYGGHPQWIASAIGSFLDQVYPHWELWICAVGDLTETARQIASEAALKDHRIKLLQPAEGNSIGSMVKVLSSLSNASFVGLMRPDDQLAPEALFETARCITRYSDTDVIFSDHDVIACDGEYVDPFFKPGWNPDLLLSINYLSPLCLVRRTMLLERSEREGFLGEDDMHAVFLQITDGARRIEHIPQILCHARPDPAAKTSVPGDGMWNRERAEVVAQALQRRGESANVARLERDRYHVSFSRHGMPLVSIIIPTRDRCGLLRRCIDSIERHTPEVRYEIIVMDNGSTEDRSLQFLDSIASRHRVVRYPQEFNFSAINNEGVAHASGEYLLFLNNDTEALASNWLPALLAQAQRPGVGAVGAKLLYPDGRIQHAGVVLGVCGVAGHAFRFLRPEDKPYHGLSEVVRSCSAVTAACLLMSKQLFEQIGGFNTRLPVEYNDVDLCLRIRQRGLRIVFDPHAVLIHHENATRKSGRSREDRLVMEELWGDLIEQGDPYYNPNLTSLREDWSLRL
jgi:O-antigen biosynthesis protein